MSRCLPYTPSMKAVDRGALLEPIKLQRDLEKKAKTHRKEEKKAKSHRKKEKREKKERKESEKKEKEKIKVHKDDVLSTCSVIWVVDAKDTLQQEVESNQLERSDVTEEHELPILSESICYLSDGTLSSAKRKRTVIRIKSLPKRSDPQSSHSSCVEPTSMSAGSPTDQK